MYISERPALMAYEYIKIEKKNYRADIILNRPGQRNALNMSLIEELHEAFLRIAKESDTRCVVITGSGDVFCAGADLNWLKDADKINRDENFNEAKRLVELLDKIQKHPVPVICRVNGPTVGGGIGLMMSSDISVSVNNIKFGLSEVAIGIVPAAIVPLVMKRIGETKGREYLLSGKRIEADEAYNIGLINYSVEPAELDEKVDEICGLIINNGPWAVKKVKEMIQITQKVYGSERATYIANVIADLRENKECIEGIDAFFNKRKPAWVVNK